MSAKKNVPSEPVRRLAALVKALRLVQHNLSFLYGTEQGNISRMLRSTDPKVPGRERVSVLVAYLSRPDVAPEGKVVHYQTDAPPLAQPFSPILTGKAGAVGSASSIMDDTISPEAWDRGLQAQLWTCSRKPFASAAILADMATLEPGEIRAARPDAIASDTKVHGAEFAERAILSWPFKNVASEAEAALRECACSAGREVLSLVAKSMVRRDRLYPWPGGEIPDLADKIGEGWRENSQNFVPGMDFLLTVLDSLEASRGKFDLEAMSNIHAVAREYCRQRQQVKARKFAQVWDFMHAAAEWEKSLEATDATKA